MTFKTFKEDMQIFFSDFMPGTLYQTDTDRDKIWEVYLKSFPEGSNPIYKERTEHDCQCCKQFIRNFGGVVAIKDNKRVSIWDCETIEPYASVAAAMSDYVATCYIKGLYMNSEKTVGTSRNFAALEDNSVQEWHHFHFALPNHLVKRDPGEFLSSKRSDFDVMYRGFTTITEEALEIVSDLIAQQSLYRGEEHKKNIGGFLHYQKKFYAIDSDDERINFTWVTANKKPHLARLRNTAIGTLLIDLSDGRDLEYAVTAFEKMVAPSNYKRPNSLITKSMIKDAQKTIKDLGLDGAIDRRYANINDITINNILWGNRDTNKSLDAFDELIKTSTNEKAKNYDHVEEVSIEHFISDIMPTAEKLEIYLANELESNLVSLIAPSNPTANMLKWNNNFSWSYNGDITDSMKELVKSFGGKVDGVLRFSIRWNDEGNNNIDFDAHCHEPNGNHIYYPSARKVHSSSGMLDVDIIDPNGKVAVENIVHIDKTQMPVGTYKFRVHNYSNRESKAGFSAEIEFDNKIYSYTYNNTLRGHQFVDVAHVSLSEVRNFTIS
jgi:hypothetical protein